MKNTIIDEVKSFLRDRSMLMLAIAILIMGIIYVVYMAFALSPSELQIATHYTAFGDTQYYRNKWYYLIIFIALAMLIVVVHIGLMIKLRSRDMRSLGFGLGWLTTILLIILFFVSHSVLGIAYLS